MPCAASCYDCLGSATACVRCRNNGTSSLFLRISDSTCVTSALCGSGYYPDSTDATNQLCLLCHYTCLQCTDRFSTSCTSCPPQTYLTAAGSCQSSCPSGFYASDATNTCLVCDGTCATCFGPSSSNCLRCPTNASAQTYLVPMNSTCSAACPLGYYQFGYTTGGQNYYECRECAVTCATCAGTATSCLSCTAGYYIIPNTTQCLERCPIIYF